MKKLLTFMLGAAALACVGADILTNGNFEAPLKANGTIPGWQADNSVLVDGLKGKCIEVTPTEKHSNTLMRGRISNRVRKFQPGKKYMLSGICRNAHALWIVAQFDWHNKIQPNYLWVGKNKLRDYDDSEWKSFSMLITVPENADILNIIIEPIAYTHKDANAKVYIDEVKLEILE